jgi:hypothetical protein
MKPEMDEVEVGRLEARIRNAAAGHKPAAPSSLVSFVGTVPHEHTPARRMSLLLGGRRLQRAGFAVAAVAAIVFAMVGSATVVSLRNGHTGESVPPATPQWSLWPSVSAEATTVDAPTYASVPSEWPSDFPTAGPSLAPGQSPGRPTPAPTHATRVAITGVVTFQLNGLPMSSWWVTAQEVSGHKSAFTAQTNGSGSFSIQVEANMEYILYAQDCCGSWYAAPGWYIPGGLAYSEDQAAVVSVGSVDVSLPIVVPANVTLSGQVTSATGAPLSGISVQATGGGTTVSTTTDGHGGFGFVVARGKYKLRFQNPSGTPAEAWYCASGLLCNQSEADWVDASSNSVSIGAFAMPSPHYINGTVGGASGPYTVTVVPQTGGAYRVESTAGGGYSVQVVRGSYKVGVTIDGHTYWYNSTSGCTSDEGSATVIDVSAGDVSAPIDIGADC